jgi:magnesium chelatase family protein
VGLARCLAVALVGLEGHLVEVEAHVADGLPTFVLVGLPDASLSESRDRVRSATAAIGLPLPSRRITVNLSPAALPKTGPAFDLAVAAALLAAADQLPAAAVARWVHLGELGLDGQVRPVRGVLPAVMSAVAQGRPEVVVPWANRAEAALVPGAVVTGVRHLRDVIALHRGEPQRGGPDRVAADEPPGSGPGAASEGGAGDLADIIGQGQARLALELAAAGGHHLLLSGPPGAGKTMLASRLTGLLPDLDDAAALEVTAVHSVAGTLAPIPGLIRRPPFENPHHTSSVVSLVGGGNGLPRPGAASRAHRGVLFLDEAAEFDVRALEALRQPLEHGELVIHRARGSARFPARFQLVLAANPCPCGRGSGKGLDCSCTPMARRRYLNRLSGPLLDRVDLQVQVDAVSRADLLVAEPGEATAVVAGRVEEARRAARFRLRATVWRANGELPGSFLRGVLRLPATVTRDLDSSLERGRLSMRGYDRVLRVAWTVADLGGRDRPDRDDVGRAMALRHHSLVEP